MSAKTEKKRKPRNDSRQYRYKKMVRISEAAYDLVTEKAEFHEAFGHVLDKLLGLIKDEQ